MNAFTILPKTGFCGIFITKCFLGFFFFFLLFQKGYAKCHSNLLISYNQNYLGQVDRQKCKMQYTTLSSPGKALVSDNSISILNFSCICILPLKKSVEPIYRGIDLGVAHYLLMKTANSKTHFNIFFLHILHTVYTVNNRFSFLFSHHHQPFLVHILRTLTYS